MLKWLENYYKREDEKFMRVIRDSSRAEKHLSDLYQARITISIALITIFVFFAITILIMMVWSGNSDIGGFLLPISMMVIIFLSIDSQIKMIQMITYIKATHKPEIDLRHEQNE